MSEPLAALPLKFDNFGVRVCFDVDEVVASVSGEVDMLTAPLMGALLRSLVDAGSKPLVLKLADLEFMDAAGLRVIVDISNLLAASDAKLTLRSTPSYTLKILHLTGVADLVQLDDSIAGDFMAGELKYTTGVVFASWGHP